MADDHGEELTALQRERFHSACLAQDLERVEAEAADLRLRNTALESLVAALMSEMQDQEFRRSRERRQRMDNEGGEALVPFAAVDAARRALVDGSESLIKHQEHTLRLFEMSLAAMSEQLERCASVLPMSQVAYDGILHCDPPSPSSSTSCMLGSSAIEDY